MGESRATKEERREVGPLRLAHEYGQREVVAEDQRRRQIETKAGVIAAIAGVVVLALLELAADVKDPACWAPGLVVAVIWLVSVILLVGVMWPTGRPRLKIEAALHDRLLKRRESDYLLATIRAMRGVLRKHREANERKAARLTVALTVLVAAVVSFWVCAMRHWLSGLTASG